jgi:L-fuculokinase
MAVAVFDIGKTNMKLSLVERGAIRRTLSAPNRALPGPPFPHVDEDAIWSFLMQGLGRLAGEARISDIVVVAHGGECALVDAAGALALPILDYEFSIEDDDYDRVASPFSETFTPPLMGGLNIARQLLWFAKAFPEAFRRARRLLLYPQYWSFRLSGVASSEVTYLGSHTGLWRPAAGGFSSLVNRMGWRPLFPPLREAGDVLGPVLPEVAAKAGLSADCRVRVGIHDSSASYLRHRLSRPSPFAVASTGTWIVSMAAGADPAGVPENRNCLVNVDALGAPVPCCLFMGGREYAELTAGLAGHGAGPQAAGAVIESASMLIPPLSEGGSPFIGRPAGGPRGPAPRSDGEAAARASLYLALMTDYCLDLLKATGPVIVEGSLIGNEVFLAALAALRRPAGVLVSSDATGTVSGAALLAGEKIPDRPAPAPALDLPIDGYRRAWREALPA